MTNYREMNRDELTAEKANLNEQYKKFLAMNLKLNMARGKPGPHQMDLAMGLLQMNDYTTDAGTDARNYGIKQPRKQSLQTKISSFFFLKSDLLRKSKKKIRQHREE